MKLTIKDIIKVLNAKVVQEGSASEVTGVSIDTRTLAKGDLFVAIKGPHFDGHDFVEDAVQLGAVCILVSRPSVTRLESANVKRSPSDDSSRATDKRTPFILQVPDTVTALGNIAAFWRRKFNCVCVAVTGSNGKSTTKEMISAALSATRKTVKTEGNFNNLIGLPLQILRLEKDTEVAIFEMGMNAPSEIKRLTEIADPDIGLITNVNPAHLEKLHTVENVAKAKGELFDAMKNDGTIIINVEDPWAVKLGAGYSGKKISFGMQNDCDVQFGRLISEGLDQTDLTFYVKKREYFMRLPVPGVHNVMNAMAAIAIGVAMDIPVTTMIPSLENFSPMKMRMERIQLLNGVQLVNDCYNANPSSMQAALRTIGSAKRAGRFVAVLGDMLELGTSAKEKHVELGKMAVSFHVSKLFVAGEYAEDVASGAKGIKDVEVVKDIEELKKRLLKFVQTGDIVLVKGSRGMKMERIVDYLKNEIGV